MENSFDKLEFFEQVPDFDVLESEYVRLLGYPLGHQLDGRALELANDARAWYAKNGSPWMYARRVSKIELRSGKVDLGDACFNSSKLYNTLKEAEADSVFVVAVGAGREIVEHAGQLWTEGKPDEYFFAETFGSAVVEHLIVHMGAKLCDWAERESKMVLPHYSPGYNEWDVSEQNSLLELIKSGTSEFKGEIEALDSGMLNPKKSLTAVFGVSSRVEESLKHSHLVPCHNCSMRKCSYRRKPYFLDTMKGIETGRNGSSNENGEDCLLNLEASYSISPRALRKWVESRLELKPAEGGGFDAVFTYDGTTCSNMGHPLRYLYRISVGRRETRYRILDASCGPESYKQEGHLKQCEYLKSGDAFLSKIESERPLVGEPLDAVLKWSHPSSPAGCFCDEGSRNHKWTIAYEVLHFALAQKEKAS